MPHFHPPFFAFLRELAANNGRPWFEANKARFHADVRDPLRAFVADFAPRLAAFAPHHSADDRSIFRIYRDTRFSKDKRPYKTHVAAHFPRRSKGSAEGDVHGAGWYLHIEPGTSYVGAGAWRPEPDVLARVRDRIVARPEEWRRVREAVTLGHDDEKLARAPRGYDPAHPFVEDLKRKGFVASVAFTEADVLSADFLDRVDRACRGLQPLVGFLDEAAGVR